MNKKNRKIEKKLSRKFHDPHLVRWRRSALRTARTSSRIFRPSSWSTSTTSRRYELTDIISIRFHIKGFHSDSRQEDPETNVGNHQVWYDNDMHAGAPFTVCSAQEDQNCSDKKYAFQISSLPLIKSMGKMHLCHRTSNAPEKNFVRNARFVKK